MSSINRQGPFSPGPAAAPAIGAKVCQSAGATDGLIVDMGGTSFDVSYLVNSIPGSSAGGEIGGLRIAFPVTDVRSIPIGGGSIAWVDRGGLLRIGPQSAGASPGPACFGRGGSSPTITDANLVLGYLDPQQFSRLRYSRSIEAWPRRRCARGSPAQPAMT